MDLTARQIAARKRVRRELEQDPLLYAKKGAKGGKAKVPKGFSSVSHETRVEIGKKGPRCAITRVPKYKLQKSANGVYELTPVKPIKKPPR